MGCPGNVRSILRYSSRSPFLAANKVDLGLYKGLGVRLGGDAAVAVDLQTTTHQSGD